MPPRPLAMMIFFELGGHHTLIVALGQSFAVVPVGGELEYIDGGTLARALSGRRQIDTSSGEGGR